MIDSRVCANAAWRRGRLPGAAIVGTAVRDRRAACRSSDRRSIARGDRRRTKPAMPHMASARTSACDSAACTPSRKRAAPVASVWPATLPRAQLAHRRATRSSPRVAASRIASKQRLLVAGRQSSSRSARARSDRCAAPVRSVAMVGSPAARPSGTTSPHPSCRDGTHSTCAEAYTAGRSSQSLKPTHSTRSVPASSRLQTRLHVACAHDLEPHLRRFGREPDERARQEVDAFAMREGAGKQEREMIVGGDRTRR